MSIATLPRVRKSQSVQLAVPANQEYAQILRLVLAGTGAVMGLNLDEIEDLKLAVGEACYSVSRERNLHDQLTIKATTDGRKLVIDVDQKSEKPSLPRLFAAGDSTEKSIGVALMKHMVDKVEYRMGRGGVQIRLVKFLHVQKQTQPSRPDADGETQSHLKPLARDGAGELATELPAEA